MQSRAFQPEQERRPFGAGLGLILVFWIGLSLVEGAKPSAYARFGPAIWPYTLIFCSALAACVWAVCRRAGWLPWALGATLLGDAVFAQVRGELRVCGLVFAAGLVALGFVARGEWR